MAAFVFFQPGAQMRVETHAHIDAHIDAHTRTHICTHAHTFIVYARTREKHVGTRAHTHTLTQSHTHTHARAPSTCTAIVPSYFPLSGGRCSQPCITVNTHTHTHTHLAARPLTAPVPSPPDRQPLNISGVYGGFVTWLFH